MKRYFFLAAAAALCAGLLRGLAAAPATAAPLLGSMLSAYKEGTPQTGLTIASPLDETLFPPDIAAQEFRWKDSSASEV
ncbi:MAG: hypothetical protein Q7R35_11515 [Elusimicrobiota bacterium]|nr:hypothetical protein [Elusimicrobiota bacterium]